MSLVSCLQPSRQLAGVELTDLSVRVQNEALASEDAGLVGDDPAFFSGSSATEIPEPDAGGIARHPDVVGEPGDELVERQVPIPRAGIVPQRPPQALEIAPSPELVAALCAAPERL